MTHGCDSPADVPVGGHCAARDRPMDHELGIAARGGQTPAHRTRGGLILRGRTLPDAMAALSAHPGPSLRPGNGASALVTLMTPRRGRPAPSPDSRSAGCVDLAT